MEAIKLLEQSPESLQQIIPECPLVLIPIGTVEWHANHLPLGVDSLLASAICDEISSQIGCCVAPLIHCGICRNLQPERGYFGTVDTIRVQTLANLVSDLLAAYAKMGFQTAVLFSGHLEPEHNRAIALGMSQASSIKTVSLSVLDFIEDRVQELGDVSLTWPYAGDHAGEWETSMMLHYFPELVHMESAPETIELDMEGLPEYIRRRFPRRASREYGGKLHRAVIDGGVDAVQRLLAAA